MLIFRRLRVARESQTGIRLREREGAQQGQRSVLADPLAKYNYSTCVAKNVPDLSQKQSFSTWRNQDQHTAAPVILDVHVIEKEIDQWSILLVWMCPWKRRISAF